MVLHPQQALIASDTHRFRVINCGRRFGKTTLAIEEIKGKMLAKPCVITYVAPTYSQARDIAWEMLKTELHPIIVQPNETRLEIKTRTLKGGESLVYLKGWESIESLRGLSFDFLILDEVAMMRDFWVRWQEVLSPTLVDRKGEVMFISTPKGFNHFYDLYNNYLKDPDFKSFHYTSYDNPYLPKEEIERQRLAIPEDSFAQEFMADFRKMKGLVYPEFNRDRHIFKDTERRIPVVEKVMGVDFGYHNPTGVLHIERDSDGVFWVTQEWYKTGKTTPEIIDYIRSYNPQACYPDPAEPDRIEEMKRAGINCREVNKDITLGIDKVRELFKQNRLKIHYDCVNLITELETYRYPDKRPDKNEEEKPVKENDHLLDSLRYVIISSSIKPPNTPQQKEDILFNQMIKRKKQLNKDPLLFIR